MTRTEAPLAWFLDNEMHTLDANAFAVWMLVYGVSVAHGIPTPEEGLYGHLHWLTEAEINSATATLVERDLLAMRCFEDELNANAVFTVTEPTRWLGSDE